jgi:hypothetical protein
MTQPTNSTEEPKPSATNEIGYPQYERSLGNFYLWTSSGTLKDKMREFAIRYEQGREDNENEIYLDDFYRAVIGFYETNYIPKQAVLDATKHVIGGTTNSKTFNESMDYVRVKLNLHDNQQRNES